jgi:hypothetical protein
MRGLIAPHGLPFERNSPSPAHLVVCSIVGASLTCSQHTKHTRQHPDPARELSALASTTRLYPAVCNQPSVRQCDTGATMHAIALSPPCLRRSSPSSSGVVAQYRTARAPDAAVCPAKNCALCMQDRRVSKLPRCVGELSGRAFACMRTSL